MGDTHVVVDRFADTPWRALQWRWRHAPGTPLTVQLHFEARQFSVEASPQWRVVRRVLPPGQQRTPRNIKSGTLSVAGNSRNLGVLVDRVQVVRLATAPW
jgi:hypothetical protein